MYMDFSGLDSALLVGCFATDVFKVMKEGISFVSRSALFWNKDNYRHCSEFTRLLGVRNSSFLIW
jgi:hypothetical protein